MAAAGHPADPSAPAAPLPPRRRVFAEGAKRGPGRLPGIAPGPGGQRCQAQQQLDTYGELLQCAWLYAGSGGRIDAEVGHRLGEVADLVCTLWRQPDAGIWEVRSEPLHFTHSKMMCWVALERAGQLADRGLLPRGHRGRWRREADACRDYIETRCYSGSLAAYAWSAGSEDLDASVLLGLLSGYGSSGGNRWVTTVDAIRRGLGNGPYVYRYTGGDGLPGTEGAFVSCSFWLAEALARTGRLAQAAALMDELVALANDVGIYAEEIDPRTGGLPRQPAAGAQPPGADQRRHGHRRGGSAMSASWRHWPAASPAPWS